MVLDGGANNILYTQQNQMKKNQGKIIRWGE